jgi:cytochrome c oxidase subunit II
MVRPRPRRPWRHGVRAALRPGGNSDWAAGVAGPDGNGKRRVIGRLFAKASGLAYAGLFVALSVIGSAAAQTAAPSGGIVGETHSSLGAPTPWGIGLQPAGGPVKEAIHDFNTLVLWIIVIITAFVMALLGWVVFKFRESVNPTPSRTSHNTMIEIAWTVIPVLILVVMAIPSFRLVYYEDRTRDADLTIKVTAHQWYWEYSYPDKNNIDFSSYIIPDDQLKPGQRRLLEVDNQLVVPVGKNIRVLQTSTDVIHSWFVPALGVQRYAIPGRTIETWFRVDKPGVFYGECNQICGTNHSRMPIVVHAVTPQEFDAWLVEAKTKFSDATPVAPSEPGKSEPRLLAAAGVQH